MFMGFIVFAYAINFLGNNYMDSDVLFYRSLTFQKLLDKNNHI